MCRHYIPCITFQARFHPRKRKPRARKQQYYLNTVAGPLTQSSFGTRDHETHRIRRGTVNLFFSRAQIMEFELEVHELAQRRCGKMRWWKQTPFDVSEAYSRFTADTSSQYAFSQPLCFKA
ncbi:cytochrome p450 [Apiospora aurea]|uniref:Cytochrome p450 n=1 Tax=Apiospora aurea TaxID=335848 RepID=A0ABR1QQH3_9PEZI